MNHRELSLVELLVILKNRLFLISVYIIICAAAAFSLTRYFITPRYTAAASLYVFNTSRESNQITSFDISAAQELVNTYIVVIRSDTVLDQVISKLNLTMTADDVRKMMKAGPINDTEAFEIKISHSDPATAQLLVNTIVDVAPGEIIRVVQAGGAEVIDYAKLPVNPSSPNMIINTLIGAAIGLFVSFGYCIARVIFDTKIHCEEDLKRVFTIAVLGSVPVLEE